MASSAASTTTDSATTTTSPAAQPTNTAAASGISAGATVGMGVGIGLGILLIAGVLGLYFWRRRTQRVDNSTADTHYDWRVQDQERMEETYKDNPGVTGCPTELHSRPLYELDQGAMPELPGNSEKNK